MFDTSRKPGLWDHLCGKIPDGVVRWGLFLVMAPYVGLRMMLDVMGNKTFGRWE